MAHERRCMMCGTEYKYCSHCNNYDPKETWKYLYHDEKCLAISNIWYKYRGNEITKEEARAQMSEYKPNIDNVLKYTSIAANEIREIFDIKEEEPVTEEKQVEEQKVEEQKVEVQQEPKQEPKKQFNNKHEYRNKHR